MSRLSEVLLDYDPSMKDALSQLSEATTLALMVMAVWAIMRILGVRLLEESLAVRAHLPETWPGCSVCGKKLQSKGFRERKLMTFVGGICWKRRVGRCPNGCAGAQVVPLDDALGIFPYQQTGIEIQKMGCLLSIFSPFNTASQLLKQLTGISVASGTVWTWVQNAGQQVMGKLSDDLDKLAQGILPEDELMSDDLRSLPLVIGGDGVMVPFRPNPGSPAGKVVWREVKVAILARLNERVTKHKKQVVQLCQRRLVAVLGTIDALAPRLTVESARQQIASAVKSAWISDGGVGYWTVFHRCLKSLGVTPILDFYHAAQNLNKGLVAWLGEQTEECRQWFSTLRHRLRHGNEKWVLTELEKLLESKALSESARHALSNLYQYLETHKDHIHYDQFKKDGLPIGSGLVESACKWLVQQRFKGVGMRWSEPGFNNVLHLRLAWVNQRFDQFFPVPALSPK